MPLALILVGLVLLLATGIGAVALRRDATRLVYGASAALTTVILLLALGRLLAGGTAVTTLVLPLGLPWIGAHLRLDALAAFFLVVVNLGGRRSCGLRARLWRARAGAGARPAVLPGVPRRHEPRGPGRRRLHLPARLGVHVADLLGAGHGAPPRAGQRACRLRLPGHGELRHAFTPARVRPARGPERRLRVRCDPERLSAAQPGRSGAGAGPARRRLQGRPRAAPRLAAARPPGRPQPRLGADERGHDQGRGLRLRAHRARPSGPARLVVEPGRAGTRRHHGGAGRALRAHAARSEAPARLPHGREHRHHLHRAWPGARLRGQRHGLCGRARVDRGAVPRP